MVPSPLQASMEDLPTYEPGNKSVELDWLGTFFLLLLSFTIVAGMSSIT